MRYALCVMRYALCAMRYALCVIISRQSITKIESFKMDNLISKGGLLPCSDSAARRTELTAGNQNSMVKNYPLY